MLSEALSYRRSFVSLSWPVWLTYILPWFITQYNILVPVSAMKVELTTVQNKVLAE